MNKRYADEQGGPDTKKRMVDEDDLIPLLNEHGIDFFRDVQPACMVNARVAARFEKTRDAAALALYFVAFPPRSYADECDVLAQRMWARLFSTRRFFLLIETLYDGICDGKGKADVSNGVYQIFQRETVAFPDLFDAMNVKNISVEYFLLFYAFHFISGYYILPYLYDRVGKYEFTILLDSMEKKLAPAFGSTTFHIQMNIFDTMQTPENAFSFFLEHMEASWLWKVCTSNFLSHAIPNADRFKALVAKHDDHTFFMKTVCTEIKRGSNWFLSMFHHIQFLKDVGILKDFLCFDNGTPVLSLLQNHHRAAWALVKDDVDINELIKHAHSHFFVFYMDPSFYRTLVTQALKRKAIQTRLERYAVDFFRECARDGDLESARWAWDLHTPRMREQFWERNEFMCMCVEKNTPVALAIFSMAYGNGFLDKKKRSTIDLHRSMFVTVNYILHNNIKIDDVILFRFYFNNDEFIRNFAFSLVYGINVSLFKSTALEQQLAIISYMNTHITKILNFKTPVQQLAIESFFIAVCTLDRLRYGASPIYQTIIAHCKALIANNQHMDTMLLRSQHDEDPFFQIIVENHHVEIFLALWSDPGVQFIYELLNFFQEDTALFETARDNESAVRELNADEKHSHFAVQQKYGPQVNGLGANNVIEVIRARLLEEFEANAHGLPFTCGSNESRTPYFRNVHHTAWRFLATPNPMVKITSDYLLNGGAYYAEYADTIAAYYLAAVDESEPCVGGFGSVDDREQYFFAQLASTNRAHNMKIFFREDGTEYEDDDLCNDDPSCYSGILRRLVISVPGNAVSSVFREHETFDELMQGALTRGFKDKWARMDKDAFHTHFDNIPSNVSEMEIGSFAFLQQLNLTEAEQNALFLDISVKTNDMGQVIRARDALAPFPGAPRVENLHIVSFCSLFAPFLNK